MANGRRWAVNDRYGNEIYLTKERWAHITDDANHPEMRAYEEGLKQAIQQGKRKQDTLNPQKYRYSLAIPGLAEDNTHLVAVVLCRFQTTETGDIVPNNYIVTAYQKEEW